MKTELATLLLVMGMAVICCQRNPPSYPPIPTLQAAPISPSAPPLEVERQVLEEGQAIAAQAFGVLGSRLGKAIAEAGYTNAIEFCSLHGIALTAAVGVTNEVVVRRVTHKPRNPVNRGDSHELAILRRFESELNTGTTPKPIVTTNKPGKITFYSPIVLGLPLCLNCHGQPGTDIKPDVMTQLQKTYPADEATGFRLGQLRGLWRVDFKVSDFAAPPPSPSATKP